MLIFGPGWVVNNFFFVILHAQRRRHVGSNGSGVTAEL